MFDTIYDESRRRVCELAATLSPEQLDTTVPATPEWTARELVAHLAGVASDAVHGRTDGAPGPAWTAPQVADRAGRSVDELAAEWAEAGAQVRAALTERRMPLQIVHDALTHEADLREAFGLGPLPADVVERAVGSVAKAVVKGVAGEGALVVRAGGQEYRGGAGDAEPTTLTVDSYELYRGLISRRSRTQMRAWDWSGDAERYVDALPVFGPRDDDQPLP
ncbi:MAG: maleylpyruvate isomerase family mycothiol-dependent enzyme [Pseudonocardia sp.]